jgi:hypothetical protein
VVLLQTWFIVVQVTQAAPCEPHALSLTMSLVMQTPAEEQQPAQFAVLQAALPHDGATAIENPMATPTRRTFKFTGDSELTLKKPLKPERLAGVKPREQ